MTAEMKITWRPDDWQNRFMGQQAWSADKQTQYFIGEIYEEGASAMVRALCSKGAFMTPKQMKLLAPDRKYPYGFLVFIPEGQDIVENMEEDIFTPEGWIKHGLETREER